MISKKLAEFFWIWASGVCAGALVVWHDSFLLVLVAVISLLCVQMSTSKYFKQEETQ